MNKDNEYQECKWTYDEYLDKWETSCGYAYYDFDAPKKFESCPNCGKSIFSGEIKMYEDYAKYDCADIHCDNRITGNTAVICPFCGRAFCKSCAAPWLVCDLCEERGCPDCVRFDSYFGVNLCSLETCREEAIFDKKREEAKDEIKKEKDTQEKRMYERNGFEVKKVIYIDDLAYYITKSYSAIHTKYLWKDGSLHNTSGWTTNMSKLTNAPGYWPTPENAKDFLDSWIDSFSQSSKEENKIRKFSTGATRDTDEDKLNYVKALSPFVLKKYVEYLGKHRFLPDGSKRDWDNWKNGMDEQVYIESLVRHAMAAWLLHEGCPVKDNHGPVTLEDALCGVIFNAMGYLYEL